MRKINWFFTLWAISVCALLAGCGDLGLDAPAEEDAAAENVSSDAEAEKMIRDNEVAEARAWLAVENGHMLWKGDRGQIKQLAERLYAAGSPKVYAAGIVKEGQTEIVAQFMAEVPADAATRAKIFQVQTEFWKSYLDEPTEEDLKEVNETDSGQKYLMFNFDL